jgi:hypothetical protein
MRRLEVERIDEMPAQQCAAWVGAGDAASGPQIKPANPRRWPRARARGLVWRPRAVPRTHGTREAPGPRPTDTRIGPQGACWTGTGANASSQEARPGAEPSAPNGALARATSGAPRGERVDRKTRAVQKCAALVGCACRRSAPLASGSTTERACPVPEFRSARAIRHCEEPEGRRSNPGFLT